VGSSGTIGYRFPDPGPRLDRPLTAANLSPLVVPPVATSRRPAATLPHQVARVHCTNCRHNFLVAFSCKGRDLCPSCATQRMVEVSAHLVDEVLPRVQHRQWVLTMPKRVRWHLRHKPEVISGLLAIFLRAVETTIRQRDERNWWCAGGVSVRKRRESGGWIGGRGWGVSQSSGDWGRRGGCFYFHGAGCQDTSLRHADCSGSGSQRPLLMLSRSGR